METTLRWIAVLFTFKQNTHCQTFGKTYSDFQKINWNYQIITDKKLHSNIVNDLHLYNIRSWIIKMAWSSK